MPVRASWRRSGERLGAEIVFALLAAAAAFLLAAGVSAAARSHVPGLLLTLPLILVVVALARFAGVIYALPVGVVSIEAFDWYFLPPTRPFTDTDAATMSVLGLFVVTAIVVGAIADRAGRRAQALEEARGVLVDEQAALRRVATLVAGGAPPEELFVAVVDEISALFDVPLVGLVRYGPGRIATAIASTSDFVSYVGRIWSLAHDDRSALASVLTTGAPASSGDYDELPGDVAEAARELGVDSAVGVPIVVDGLIWGAVLIAVSSGGARLPANTIDHLTDFTELVATAISNAAARTEVERLAEEQAGLRHVATLVARSAPPAELFAAVTEEVGQLLPVDLTALSRYESDGTVTVVAGWRRAGEAIGLGSRPLLGGPNVSTLVWQTGRAARMDSYDDDSTGGLAALIRDTGIRSAVGAPIIVEGKLWGVMIAACTSEKPLPPDTEARLSDFTGLVATAISNTEARAELTASRARVVTAADDARRRLERDLHDGIQQRLVSLALEVRTAETMVTQPAGELHGQLAKIVDGLGAAVRDLREISRGIHPAILSEGGLGPALKALARRATVPVALDVKLDGRLEEHLEVAAYYVASEGLANAAKHARATKVDLRVGRDGDVLALSIHDDGVGGADPSRGSGLTGLADRVEALGGTISVVSPPGDGTSVLVTLPASR